MYQESVWHKRKRKCSNASDKLLNASEGDTRQLQLNRSFLLAATATTHSSSL